MIGPGGPRKGVVLQRTIRALFCLAGILWLLILQSPLGDDRFSATGVDSSALASAAAMEILQTGDDLGAALEDSIEMLRVDLHEFSAPVDPLAVPKVSATNAARRSPALSPPLLV